MINDHYGVIGEQYDERDWLITDDLKIPRAPKGTNSWVLNGAVQINQLTIAKYTCTLAGSMGAYSDLTGYKFTDKDKQEIYQEALNRGFNPDLGWWINSAVKLIAEWVNGNLNNLQKVNYYRLDVGSFEFLSVMRLGYSPIVGYNGSQLFSLDKGDGILDETSHSERTHGHCLRLTYSIGDEYDLMVDNYPYKHLNVYRVPTRNWKKLVSGGTFFKSAYIYTIQNT